MKNLINMIMEILNKLVKKKFSESNEPVIEEETIEPVIENIEPKLTVSDGEPTGGEDRDVWVKVKNGGE